MQMYHFKERLTELINFLLYPVGVFLFEYLNIDRNLVEVLGILMFFDSIFGSYKAIRMGYKWRLTTFLWGLTSKIAILFIPVILAIMGKSIDWDFDSLVYLIISLMIVGEGLSSISNIYSGKYKIKLEKFDVIQLMFKALRLRLQKTVLVIVKQIEGDADCGIKDREQEIERIEEEINHEKEEI